MNVPQKTDFDLSKEYVLFNEVGIVLIPRFSFNKDGYIHNFSNADFYKWRMEDKTLLLLDSFNEITATLNKIASEWQGERITTGERVKLLEYNKEHNMANNNAKLVDRLKNTRWRYRNDSNQIFSDNVWLCGDGTISGYDHPNERYWRVDHTGLGFYNEENVKTTDFSFLLNHGDQFRFTGRFLLAQDKIHNHILEYIQGKDENFLSELYAVQHYNVSHRKSDTLLLIFNSVGNLYNGIDTNWEFYNLPYRCGTDFIRFSESFPNWYCDKKELIFKTLENLVQNYRKIISVGMSAGGYAALIYSELLASKCNNTQFFTITLNPQTSLTVEDRRCIIENFKEPYRPAIPTDYALKASELGDLDLNSFLVNQIKNLQHEIYYDSMNKCEQYFISKLNLTRVRLIGLPMNNDHAEFIRKIYDLGIVQNRAIELAKS